MALDAVVPRSLVALAAIMVGAAGTFIGTDIANGGDHSSPAGASSGFAGDIDDTPLPGSGEAGMTGAPTAALEGDGIPQDGEFVAWEDCGFEGKFFDFAGDHKSYDGITFRDKYTGATPTADPTPDPKTPVDDNISSVANLSTVNSVNAYIFEGFTGPRLVVLPGHRLDLCTTATDFDDKLSSHHF